MTSAIWFHIMFKSVEDFLEPWGNVQVNSMGTNNGLPAQSSWTSFPGRSRIASEYLMKNICSMMIWVDVGIRAQFLATFYLIQNQPIGYICSDSLGSFPLGCLTDFGLWWEISFLKRFHTHYKQQQTSKPIRFWKTELRLC